MVGDGKRIKFLKDKWCGVTSLDVAFPSLFSFTSAKEALMGNVWCG